MMVEILIIVIMNIISCILTGNNEPFRVTPSTSACLYVSLCVYASMCNLSQVLKKLIILKPPQLSDKK